MITIPAHLLLAGAFDPVVQWCVANRQRVTAEEVVEVLRQWSDDDFEFLRQVMNRPSGRNDGGTKGVYVRGTVINACLTQVKAAFEPQSLTLVLARAQRLIVFVAAEPAVRRKALAQFADRLNRASGHAVVPSGHDEARAWSALRLAALHVVLDRDPDMSGLLALLAKCPDTKSGRGNPQQDPSLRFLIRSRAARIGVMVASTFTDPALAAVAFQTPNIAKVIVQIGDEKHRLGSIYGYQIARLVNLA
jgi:hypothetical protein